MPQLGRTHHANTTASPIPIRVFTPAIAMPRQTTAGMLSDWRLWNTAFPDAIGSTQWHHAASGKSFQQGTSFILAAGARPLASLLRDRFSADQDRHIRGTETSMVPCHREEELKSRRPRSGGKLVVLPVPCDTFPLVREPVNFRREPSRDPQSHEQSA